ncbi:hypothetical protein V494_04322 [Pseudogymnoascus sp. VKM F-4513 (FW-928)]|nr:hypothetical protein V494_04322 [Pseudogymnoascus sp. VKM F-4513 (FW-928)]
MKVLIAGASGSIGGEILKHLLQRSEVSKIIALTRKPFPDQPSRVENILVPDFGDWEQLGDEKWEKIRDADAMVWAIGTYDLNEDVNTRYPLAFQDAFAAHLSSPRNGKISKFRFILLSGAFVEPDQSRTLLFLPQQRKGKGITETKTVEFAEQHKEVWEALVIRPSGILIGQSLKNSVAAFVMGSMVVKGDELGAFVADIVVNGSEETVIKHSTIVGRGRELLHDANWAWHWQAYILGRAPRAAFAIAIRRGADSSAIASQDNGTNRDTVGRYATGDLRTCWIFRGGNNRTRLAAATCCRDHKGVWRAYPTATGKLHSLGRRRNGAAAGLGHLRGDCGTRCWLARLRRIAGGYCGAGDCDTGGFSNN